MRVVLVCLSILLTACTGQMKCLMSMGSGSQPTTQVVGVNGQAHVVSYNKPVPVTPASGSWSAYCPQNHRAELIARRQPKTESEWAAIDADMAIWRLENGWDEPPKL